MSLQKIRSDEGQRILVAEDSPVIRALVRALLASSGFAVDVAADGAEAIRLAADRRYALILMDINMPTLGGLEAASRIRALAGPTQGAPILAMTVEQGLDTADDMVQAGMNDHVAKPFGRQQLLDAIAPWIE